MPGGLFMDGWIQGLPTRPTFSTSYIATIHPNDIALRSIAAGKEGSVLFCLRYIYFTCFYFAAPNRHHSNVNTSFSCCFYNKINMVPIVVLGSVIGVIARGCNGRCY